jgi:hypothetical protein
MANLNHPAIVRGPLLAHEMHRVTVVCPPCTGDCRQGRQCAANTPAEACTEIGADSWDDYDGTAVFRGLFSAVAITAILAGVVMALN